MRFTAEVWRHPGDAGWHFVTVPAELADELRARTAGAVRPFGMVRVVATIGGSRWSTSLFYDRKHESYLLPVRAAVRAREGLGDGAEAEVQLAADAL